MALVSPFYKIRCPYCRKESHPCDMSIASLMKNGKVLYRPPRRGTPRYYYSRFWAPELGGEKYTTELARRVCPVCSNMLPEREVDETLNIAIVGDTSSGKTHYIAVLIDQLKRGIMMQAANGSTRLISLNPETEQKYRNIYYTPILQDRDARQGGTKPGNFGPSGEPIKSDPLVYQFTINEDHMNPGRAFNLLFYDISGEEIADPTLIVQFGEHILRADAIIYLADPVTMERVRGRLPRHLQPDPASISARTAHEVLANIMYRYEQYQRIRPGGSISIPTAITLSKSDLLRYTIPVSEQRNYLIFQRTSYDGKAHPQEFARIHQEVVACLHAYDEQAILKLSGRFSCISFFAASATGTPPDSKGKYILIEPLRCLDPFMWVLWKLGCIEAT